MLIKLGKLIGKLGIVNALNNIGERPLFDLNLTLKKSDNFITPSLPNVNNFGIPLFDYNEILDFGNIVFNEDIDLSNYNIQVLNLGGDILGNNITDSLGKCSISQIRYYKYLKLRIIKNDYNIDTILYIGNIENNNFTIYLS